MKIALQFAMPSELHALPGARELAPLETVSGVPIFEIAPDILACAGGVSKVNAAMAAELLCLAALSAMLQAMAGLTPQQYVLRHPGGALGALRAHE